MATIRRVSNMEHNFQLVITRVYEDGDQELLEDEDESELPLLCMCLEVCTDTRLPVAFSGRRAIVPYRR